MGTQYQNSSGAVVQSEGRSAQDMANQGWTPVSSGSNAPTDQQQSNRSSLKGGGMTLGQAQSQAESAFGGLVAPMTLDQINQREDEAQAGVLETAESVYDPAISRQKQVGGSQVSTAEGVVGQRQGFNISTAEQAFVADVQNKVQDRVKEVENTKAAYISQGNLAAANRADDQLQQLNEWNSQMTIAKANYALQIMAGDRDAARLGMEQERLDLERQGQEFNQGMAEESLAISIAGLTGDYNGSPTFAATQANISNALQEAGLTGFYNGEKTIQAVAQEAQLALAEKGYDLSVQQLQEQIRSNRAQEGLAGARLAEEQNKNKVKTPTDVVNDSVNRLSDLRNSGEMNDANWAAEVRILASTLGYPEESIGALGDMVWKAMDGDPTYKTWLANQANQNAGSDFEIESPDAPKNITTKAGAAVKNFIAEGGVLPYMTEGVLQFGVGMTNFVNGLTGGKEITPEEKAEVIKLFTEAGYKQ